MKLEHLGWASCDSSELMLAIVDGVKALEWSAPEPDDGPFEIGGGQGHIVNLIGDFYTPVWKKGSTLYLMGHHKYADDDIAAFSGGYENWGAALIHAVGEKLVALEADESTEVGTLDVPSGCLAFVDPLAEAPLGTAEQVEKVSEGGPSFATSEASFFSVAPGRYRLLVEELHHMDPELGTFNGRVQIILEKR